MEGAGGGGVTRDIITAVNFHFQLWGWYNFISVYVRALCVRLSARAKLLHICMDFKII